MGEYHCTNGMAKFQGAVPEGFRQKVKGPMDYWSAPSIWGVGREYEAGGRDLHLLRASCFWICGEGCCLDNGEELPGCWSSFQRVQSLPGGSSTRVRNQGSGEVSLVDKV